MIADQSMAARMKSDRDGMIQDKEREERRWRRRKARGVKSERGAN